jgi:hypothetical protein
VLRLVVPALALAIQVLTAAGTPASPQPASAPPPKTHSTKDSPGWYPVVDPESMSVVIGRRTNAPLVKKPFQGGARSLDDLGRAVCRSLERSDPDSLMLLCVRVDEFRDILWREFPQSRPVTGLTWEDGWRVLSIRLMAGCREGVRDHGGRAYEFVRFETDSLAKYKNFRLHSGLTLVARDEQGTTHRMRWLRTVAERKGAYKIYSTVD